MAKSPKDLLVDGECQVCGFPGIVGLSCSECGGQVIGFSDTASATKEKTDRYDEADLIDDDTVSLEELAVRENNESETLDEAF